jgi:hypothetical protein
MLKGYNRKGTNRPALTGRPARRHKARAQARALARKHGMAVITHTHRARVAAHNTGLLLAEQFLANLAGNMQFAAKYGSAFGKACLAEHRRNHGGAYPAQDGWCIAGGRIRAAYTYGNELDLWAGALAYPRTKHLASVPAAVEATVQAPAMQDAPDDNPQNIQAGGRVRLAISECPDPVCATVVRVHRDALGILVADVQIRPGDIRPQNVEFLTRVGSPVLVNA